MHISARSILTAGIATIGATAIAISPVQAPPAPPPTAAPAPTIHLAAQTRTVVDRHALSALVAAVQQRSPNANVAAPLVVDDPAPSAALVAFPGLGSAIINTYNFIEPIVAYGVELAQYFVGFIPYGYLISDQIGIFYFTLIEPIAQSITYNIANFIGGSTSFVQGVINVIDDSIGAGINFGIAEINFGLSLIGFPPLPFAAVQQASTVEVAADQFAAPEVGVTNVASDLVNAIYIPVRNGIDYGVNVFQAVLAPIPLANIAGDQASILWNVLAEPIADSVVFGAIDPILNAPLNINSYINGAINVGATTVNSLIATGFAEADYFLGGPFLAQANAEEATEFKTSEVSSVPSPVKNTLSGLQNPIDTEANVDGTRAGPLAEVTKTVREVRKEVRASLSERRADKLADAGDNGVVRAQGEVRGRIANAVNDVVNAVSGDGPGKSADDAEAAKAPSTTVAKSVRDTVKKVVKDVREATKDARQAAKDRTANDEE